MGSIQPKDSKIEVTNKSGKTISIRLDKQTSISRDKKKVDRAALKAGQSLVVDAYGDTEDDSLAVEIRIVPPIRAGQQ
jgi:dihydropteroate synthase